jgi:hypothetical protein
MSRDSDINESVVEHINDSRLSSVLKTPREPVHLASGSWSGLRVVPTVSSSVESEVTRLLCIQEASGLNLVCRMF